LIKYFSFRVVRRIFKKGEFGTCMGKKWSSYIEKNSIPSKWVYFSLPTDHEKGDFIEKWEHFSPYEIMSDNPFLSS